MKTNKSPICKRMNSTKLNFLIGVVLITLSVAGMLWLIRIYMTEISVLVIPLVILSLFFLTMGCTLLCFCTPIKEVFKK